MENQSGQDAGWDSREKWTTELIFRIHECLNANQADIKTWFERLADFYDLASCAVEDSSAYEIELNRIEALIYAVKEEGKVINDVQRKYRHEEAYKRMRAFFRALHKEIYKKGLLIPFKEVYDEVEGFKAQFK